MGLVARIIEATGIPTVSVHVVRTMMEGLPAPRNVFLRFRLGQVFGRPGATEQQRAVVRDALRALTEMERAGDIHVLHHRLGGRPR